MTAAALAKPGPAVAALRRQARLVANEAGKGLRLLWRRRALTASTLAMNAVIYLGITLFIGGGHIVRPLMILNLPALTSVVAVTAALQGSGRRGDQRRHPRTAVPRSATRCS